MNGNGKSNGVKVGDRYISDFTGIAYEVGTIKDYMAVLHSVDERGSLDGKRQVITEKGNLKIFYKPFEATA